MKNIRDEIILEEGLLYLDFTASGLAYRPIEEEINKILHTYANTHSEVGYNADLTTKRYAEARDSLRQSLELNSEYYILPAGTGATGAIKKFQELLGLYVPPATRKRYEISDLNRPLVILGPFEHHSNEVSFREGICDVIRCPLNAEGSTDSDFLEKTLEDNKSREIIGTFSAVSNVTGVKNDLETISELIRKYDGIMCVDVASSSAYMNIDTDHYDAMFMSPHKLVGGPGSCGLLVIKKSISHMTDKPTFAGGGTVSYVSREEQVYSENLEEREDAGTPGILQFIRASLAYKLRNEVGLDKIKKKEEELKSYFYKKIKTIKGIDLYCSEKQNKLPVFSFNIDGFTPYYIAGELSDKYRIQTRAGCSCAGPYGHDLLDLEDGIEFDSSNKPGWLRVGFHYIHNKEDIDYFIDSLNKIVSK